MRKLIIAGRYSQYREWLERHRVNPRAALYVHDPEQLAGLDPLQYEIELYGDYGDNPVYGSAALRLFRNRQRLAS